MKPRIAKLSTGKVPAGILFQLQASSADIRIRKIARAIERRQFDSIHQLAKLVDLSGSRLSHLFKELTGLRLSELLVKQRLERAAHLLRSTEMPVREISDQVGYRHAPSFVRAFKRIFDCSPIVYRIRERVVTETYRGLALRPKKASSR